MLVDGIIWIILVVSALSLMAFGVVFGWYFRRHRERMAQGTRSPEEVPAQLTRQIQETQLLVLYATENHLEKSLERINKAIKQFPETGLGWREIVDALRGLGPHDYIFRELHLAKEDPLRQWFLSYTVSYEDRWTLVKEGGDTDELLRTIRLQNRVWAISRARAELELEETRKNIKPLEKELGMQAKSLRTTEEKREKLKAMRVRVADFEREILEEEGQGTSGPMRGKHGISTDDP